MQSLFSPGPWCKQRLPPRGKFLFPLVLWISCDEAPLVFKTKCSQGSSWCQNLMWGSELSPLWQKIIFQLMAHPPEDMGCDYILNIMPLLQCYFGFFFVLGGKCIFYIFWSFFFFLIDAICCDLDVFMKGDELKSFFYSAILCPAPIWSYTFKLNRLKSGVQRNKQLLIIIVLFQKSLLLKNTCSLTFV